MSHNWLLFWTLTIFLLNVAAVIPGNAKPISNNMKYELARNRKSLALLKTIIEEMDTNLARVFSKRGCEINLPGFDCENSKLIHTGDDAAWWGGSMSPGKKRGACFNADGSSCDTAQIAQEMSNRRPWNNGPGRRKRHSM